MSVIEKSPRQSAAKPPKTGGAKPKHQQATNKQTAPEPVSYKRATYQDVLDAPPHKVAEIIDGRLYTHSRGPWLHAKTRSYIGMGIGIPYDKGRGGPGGWHILRVPEIHFGTPPDENILVPDQVGWRRERMQGMPETDYFNLVPDWVCEVLSPATRTLDLGRKREIYADEGVPYLWFVDPDSRTLEAFKLQDGEWVPIASLTGDDPVSVPPFGALDIPLTFFWD